MGLMMPGKELKVIAKEKMLARKQSAANYSGVTICAFAPVSLALSFSELVASKVNTKIVGFL